MEKKLIKGGIAYFIDFRGKIKSGCIYSDLGEKLGVMGLGTVTKSILYPSRDAAKKDKEQKERDAKRAELKTHEKLYMPCAECRHNDFDLCDAFCITKTIDDRYYHELFKRKRKSRNE